LPEPEVPEVPELPQSSLPELDELPHPSPLELVGGESFVVDVLVPLAVGVVPQSSAAAIGCG
jgi:hypothetical protein